MYISSRKDELFRELPWSAKLILWEVEEMGGTWGAWYYEEFEVAICESYDGYRVEYYELDICMTDKDVTEIKRAVSTRMRDDSECWHTHDCCGCLFFSRLEMIRANKNRWIVKESWGRNI